MSNNQIQREWLALSKIRKKLIWLRYGTEMIVLQKHYDVAIAENNTNQKLFSTFYLTNNQNVIHY